QLGAIVRDDAAGPTAHGDDLVKLARNPDARDRCVDHQRQAFAGVIRIVLSGLRGEDSIADLCRREGIVQNLYYRWSKEFLEAGKKRLPGDTVRAATSDEVKELRREASALKEVVAELTLENRLLKKARSGLGRTAHEISCGREVGDHPAGRAIPIAGAP